MALLLGMAVAARWALNPAIEARAPYTLFLLPVIAAAWQGGWPAGIFAALLSSVFGSDAFWHSVTSSTLTLPATTELAPLAAFAAEALVVSLLVHRFGNANRRAEKLVATEREIRKEAERARTLLQLTTNHLPVAVSYIDGNQNYVFVNETFQRWVGKPAGEILGQKMEDVLGVSQKNASARQMEAALRGETVSFEITVPAGDGRQRAQVVTFTPDRAADGVVRGFVVLAQDVTEAKEREAKLAASEERFRQLAENLPGHVFYVKEQKPNRVVYVSPAYERLWGNSAASLYQNPLGFLNAVHPDDRQIVLGMAEAEGRGDVAEVEYRLLQPGGGVRWILDRSFPIFNQRGEAYRTAGIAADITERKLAEFERQRLLDAERRANREAAAQRARLSALFMQAPGAVSIATGPQLRYELANDTYERMTGRGPLVGRTVEEVYEGMDPKILEIMRRVAFHGERFTSDEIKIELDWQGDGQMYPRFFNLLYEPVFSPDGQPEGIMTFSYEITQQVVARKLLEASAEAHKESEQNFRNLAEAVPHMVWTAEPDGRPSFFNRRWADYTGTAPQEGFGGDWSRFLHRDDVAPMGTRWKKSLRTGVPLEQEVRLLRKDGVYRWHLIRASAVRDEHGKLVRWYGTVTDIQELREAMNARDRLLAICSHELKTPVTSLKLQNQLAKKAIERNDPTAFDRDRVTNLVDRADVQLARLGNLIDEMLDFSRISQGKFSVTPAPGDLSSAVLEGAEKMRPFFAAKRVPLKLEVEKGIEATFDPLRLEQVVANLLDNALKYGEGKPVTLVLNRRPDGVDLRVQDQGAGIAAEYRDRIFEPYERALSPESITGLGMGLYITRQILTAHGGTVSVDSMPTRGTEFKVRLPYGAGAAGLPC